MTNQRIRTALISADMRLYELEDLLKVSESKLTRMMRRELPEEEQDRIIKLIENQTKESSHS